MTASFRTDDFARLPSKKIRHPSGRGETFRKRGTLGALAAGAGLLAGTALVVRALARKAERRNPPTGRFLTVDGVDVHYEDHGDGPPVVLIHGNGTFVQDWSLCGVTDRLVREGHRVVVIDRPGYGYTTRPRNRLWTGTAQAELIAHTLRKLEVGPAVIVGHSWGTIAALALALDHPAQVQSLVLLSGYYYPTRRADVWLMAPPAVPVVGDVMRYTISPVLARLIAGPLFRKVFAPRPVPHRFREGFPLDFALRPSQLRASAADSGLMVPSAAQLQDRYTELTMPVTIMTGDGDGIVTPENQAFRLHQEVGHSSLRLYPGIGHMLHYYAQDEIVAQAKGLGRNLHGESDALAGAA